MKVLFALSIHRSEDERVFFQQMKTLNKNGFQTSVVSLINEGLMDGTFSTGEKITCLIDTFRSENPRMIVADSPIVVLSAWFYKWRHNRNLRIVYDITEWVPSKKNLTNCRAIFKPLKWVFLFFFSFLAGCLTSAFIFGEYHKALPFRLFFPYKPHLYLSYYASFEQIKRHPKRERNSPWRFCYSGGLSEEKGFDKLISVLIEVAKIRPNSSFIFKVFSSEKPQIEQLLPDNVKLDWCGYLSFDEFCNQIGDADIYFDLRKIDFENTRCLPIKLFYYMASARVVIYSNLEAIPIGVPEIESLGALVDPSDIFSVVEAVLNYIDNEELYLQHCKNAEFYALNKYNWSREEISFVNFMRQVGNE